MGRTNTTEGKNFVIRIPPKWNIQFKLDARVQLLLLFLLLELLCLGWPRDSSVLLRVTDLFCLDSAAAAAVVAWLAEKENKLT